MSIYGIASGILDGQNPPFTVEDFRTLMPSFSADVVDDRIVDFYIQQADAVVKEARWHKLWREGMRLYVSHFLTLYLQSNADPEAGRTGVLNAGGVNGIATAKTVGAVSVTYDINVANGDLNGWASWKLTSYGAQYATLARMLCKGGMYVH